MHKWQWPINKDALENDKKCGIYCGFSRKVFKIVIVSPLLFISKKCAEKKQMKINILKTHQIN